jgi:hypothetical protein
MNQSLTELHKFHRFIGSKLAQGKVQLSPEEVLDEWRELYPDSRDVGDSAATVRAVRQALADREAGDRGTPAPEVLAQLRARLALPEE